MSETVEYVAYLALAVRSTLLRRYQINPRCTNLCSFASVATCIIAERLEIEDVRFAGGVFTAFPNLELRFGDEKSIAAKHAVVDAPHAWVHTGRHYVDSTLTQFIDCDPVAVFDDNDPRFKLVRHHDIGDALFMVSLCGWPERLVLSVVDEALGLIENDCVEMPRVAA